MNVIITAIRQSISLHDGSMSNTMVLELPNGELLEFPVEEGAVQKILAAFEGAEEPAPQPLLKHPITGFRDGALPPQNGTGTWEPVQLESASIPTPDEPDDSHDAPLDADQI